MTIENNKISSFKQLKPGDILVTISELPVYFDDDNLQQQSIGDVYMVINCREYKHHIDITVLSQKNGLEASGWPLDHFNKVFTVLK